MVSYHGSSVMVELARPGRMNPLTRQSLHRALFTRDTCTLEQPGEYNDQEQHRWDKPATLATEPAMAAADPWSWQGPAANVTGPAFGGSLEVIDFHLRTGRYLLPDDSYDGAILFLEASEELPPASYVYRVLMCMGERGLLQRFAALVWARPKAWAFDQPSDPAAKARYTASQRDAVLSAVTEYHPGAPVVFGVDFGHTDPQHVIPSGGTVTVDGQAQQIQVAY